MGEETAWNFRRKTESFVFAEFFLCCLLQSFFSLRIFCPGFISFLLQFFSPRIPGLLNNFPNGNWYCPLPALIPCPAGRMGMLTSSEEKFALAFGKGHVQLFISFFNCQFCHAVHASYSCYFRFVPRFFVWLFFSLGFILLASEVAGLTGLLALLLVAVPTLTARTRRFFRDACRHYWVLVPKNSKR